MRLNQQGLSLLHIESIPDLTDRERSYQERERLAPIILREILDEADRRHHAMMARIEESRRHNATRSPSRSSSRSPSPLRLYRNSSTDSASSLGLSISSDAEGFKRKSHRKRKKQRRRRNLHPRTRRRV